MRLYISKNSGDYNASSICAIQGSNEAWANYTNQNISGILYLAANDSIRLMGGVAGVVSNAHTESYFGAHLLG